jgi:deoxycytidylate deaminase
MQGNLLDIGYFRLAKNVSKYSDHNVKVGCVLSYKRPISVACNKSKTHPKYANPYTSFVGSLHAEVRAIINSGVDNLEGYTIYVYREHSDGTPGMSRPCKYCMKLLKDVGIKFIYYTTDEFPFWKKEVIKYENT